MKINKTNTKFVGFKNKVIIQKKKINTKEEVHL